MANRTTIIEFTNETISQLASQTYTFESGLTPFFPFLVIIILWLISYNCKNYVGVIASGITMIAISFSNVPFTNIFALNFMFVILLGISIFFNALFTLNRYKQEQETKLNEEKQNGRSNKDS